MLETTYMLVRGPQSFCQATSKHRIHPAFLGTTWCIVGLQLMLGGWVSRWLMAIGECWLESLPSFLKVDLKIHFQEAFLD